MVFFRAEGLGLGAFKVLGVKEPQTLNPEPQGSFVMTGFIVKLGFVGSIRRKRFRQLRAQIKGSRNYPTP